MGEQVYKTSPATPTTNDGQQQDHLESKSARVARLTAGLGPRKPVEADEVAVEAGETREEGSSVMEVCSNLPDIKAETVVVTETRDAAVQTVTFEEYPPVDPMDVVYEDEEPEETIAYEYGGIINETLLGEGLECQVYRGLDAVTKQPIIVYKAKTGKEAFLQNYAEKLSLFAGREGWMKVLHSDEESMVCEDVGTVPLEEKLQEMPLKERYDLVFRFLERVEELHQAGFLHRDLRPDQIFLDPNGTLYLGDLGVAIAQDEDAEMICSLEDPNHARATSHYKAIFASSDVAEAEDEGEDFTFDRKAEGEVCAKVAATLLTKRLPTRGVAKALKKLKVHEPGLKERIEVMKKCLERASDERENRYRSVDECLQDMRSPEAIDDAGLKAYHSLIDGLQANDAAFKNPSLMAHDLKQLTDRKVLWALKRVVRPLHERLLETQTSSEDESYTEGLSAFRAQVNESLTLVENGEEEMIQQLREIGLRRSQFDVTKDNKLCDIGDGVILEGLAHSSERVRMQALDASLFNCHLMDSRGEKRDFPLNWKWATLSDQVSRVALEVFNTSAETEHPELWEECWDSIFERSYDGFRVGYPSDSDHGIFDVLIRFLTHALSMKQGSSSLKARRLHEILYHRSFSLTSQHLDQLYRLISLHLIFKRSSGADFDTYTSVFGKILDKEQPDPLATNGRETERWRKRYEHVEKLHLKLLTDLAELPLDSSPPGSTQVLTMQTLNGGSATETPEGRRQNFTKGVANLLKGLRYKHDWDNNWSPEHRAEVMDRLMNAPEGCILLQGLSPSVLFTHGNTGTGVNCNWHREPGGRKNTPRYIGLLKKFNTEGKPLNANQYKAIARSLYGHGNTPERKEMEQFLLESALEDDTAFETLFWKENKDVSQYFNDLLKRVKADIRADESLSKDSLLARITRKNGEAKKKEIKGTPYDEFLAKTVEKMEKVFIGDPEEEVYYVHDDATTWETLAQIFGSITHHRKGRSGAFEKAFRSFMTTVKQGKWHKDTQIERIYHSVEPFFHLAR